MEILNPYSKQDEIADAVKGYWGKLVEKDFSLVYFGQAIIGIGDKDLLDKKCAVKHYSWQSIGDNIWFAIIK